MKQTVLFQKHVQAKAKMTDFQGWQVPLVYSDVQNEYHAVRHAAGLFDLSSLGRIEISGPDASSLLQRVFTRNLDGIQERSVHFGIMCNEAGFVLDTAVLFRRSDSPAGPRFFLCTSALNTEKIISWLKQHATPGVQIIDRTRTFSHLSLQGPKSAEVLEQFLGSHYKRFKPRMLKELHLPDMELFIARTGSLGEHGFEILVAAAMAEAAWDLLLSAGSGSGLVTCGLACREIVRIEMGFPAYGSEIDETRTPVECGLLRFISFNKDFIGKESVLAAKIQGAREKLAGYVMVDKSVPRPGGSIYSENREIGQVTSSAFSPSLRTGIGLGYVITRYAQLGQEIEIEIRDREVAARIVELPMHLKK